MTNSALWVIIKIAQEVMRLHKDRIYLAKTIKKYAMLGLARKNVGEYEKISIIKGFARTDSEFCDLVAVSDMIKVIYTVGREEDLRIFLALYLKGREMRVVSQKNDVSTNALRVAMKTHQDVRTVYRKAAHIENLYFKIRKI